MSSVVSFTFNAVELCVVLCSLSMIGLLQGGGMMTIMMMIVIIGMIKINFSSGMKNERIKKPQ